MVFIVYYRHHLLYNNLMLNELKKYITGTLSTDCKTILNAYNKTICLDHTRNVAKKAIELAAQFNLDANKLESAAYLHDISVVIPRNDYVTICNDFNIKVLDMEKKLPILLHQKVSKIIATEIFNINDIDILFAISCHTTLKTNPSQYDMALFAADKLMWDQGGVPPFYYIVSSALNHSLEKACLAYIDYVMDNGMILKPNPDLVGARTFLSLNF